MRIATAKDGVAESPKSDWTIGKYKKNYDKLSKLFNAAQDSIKAVTQQRDEYSNILDGMKATRGVQTRQNFLNNYKHKKKIYYKIGHP